MLKQPKAYAVLTVFLMVFAAFGQRPRMNDNSNQPAASTSLPPPAPQTVKAKYEGGVFGYNHKMDGTINFDDTNNLLMFRNDKQKEVFPIPYKAITGAYADTHAVRPKAASVGSVVGSVVPFGGLTGLIKTKVRYLTLQYNDPDSNAAGITSFRLENKDILDSVLNSLANKAGLVRRGEVFVKKKE
jgi:hypothetical protein